jgi:hypothetical protein
MTTKMADNAPSNFNMKPFTTKNDVNSNYSPCFGDNKRPIGIVSRQNNTLNPQASMKGVVPGPNGADVKRQSSLNFVASNLINDRHSNMMIQ